MSEEFNIKHVTEIRQLLRKARLHNAGVAVLQEWQIFNLQTRQRELLQLLGEGYKKERRQHLSLIKTTTTKGKNNEQK